MGNGVSLLDKEGCEYGRQSRMKSDIYQQQMLEKLQETNKKVEKIQVTLEGMKKEQTEKDIEQAKCDAINTTKTDMKSWEHYVAIGLIDLVVTGMGFWFFANVIVGTLGG